VKRVAAWMLALATLIIITTMYVFNGANGNALTAKRTFRCRCSRLK
jgi:hypothetical protein